MNLIELSNYNLQPANTGNGLINMYFALSQGDTCSIEADSSDDAQLFLRAVATLVRPETGTYLYKEEKLVLYNYRKLLPFKKKIGYITPSSALLSNRTLRENLLLIDNYYNNSLSRKLNETTEELCDMFKITNKLEMRPTNLNQLEKLRAITIRELIKSPDFLIIERPEDYIWHTSFDEIDERLKSLLVGDKPVIFYSYDNDFTKKFSNKKILITGGHVTTVNNT
ncbi:MAG: hypothetical protein HN931_02295 [Desulfobacterales bacterium]|nr:hypothetical protein [Desulfobacteraceae bacterium]MBT4364483.1 hypothetical protein [Desulfobacteraceae bacterium]MBT7084986.1 hypothetical protein [Desulfobacterales bacterium]